MFLVCGEALFDFFLESERGPGEARFDARAGGSPFNVAIGLARLGKDVGLLTGISRDLLGARLGQVLRNEGVASDYLISTDRPTTVSLVGIDAQGVPAYQFYDAQSASSGLQRDDLPRIGDDVRGFHFGSYSVVREPVADAQAALAEAYADRFVSLDPNVRPTVEPDMDIWREKLGALDGRVSLLKISSEDLGLLYPGVSPETYAADRVSRGAVLVVVTDGEGAARAWHTSGDTVEARPPVVDVIDTVGAGDTFQAALIDGLLDRPGDIGVAVRELDRDALAQLVSRAARAAAVTCTRRGADLPSRSDLAG